MKTRCKNGHLLTPDNVKCVVEWRFSKRLGINVIYQSFQCRRCRRVTKKLAMRKRRANGKSLWRKQDK